MWVRPIFTMSFHSSALAAIASRRAFTEGTNRSVTLTAAAIYMAEGKESFDDCAMFTWSFGWTGALLAERRASKLAAAIRDHLVHVHVELRAAAGHPDVQGKHVVMLAGENFVADLDDQSVGLVSQPLAGVVGNGSRLFEDGIGRDHLTRDQILADAEMLERALRLRSPELVRRDI